VNGSISSSIRTNVNGNILDTDYTVLATSDVNLPTPSATNVGRIYIIVDDSMPSTININGSFRKNGTTFTNYTLDAGGSNNSSLMVQSDGTNWLILSKF
jgi:hypothetical protein